MTLLVRDIIADARDEHPSFTRERHSQRAAVRYLSERHRHHVRALADELKDRLTVPREIATVISGALVGVDAGGNPYTISTGADGYAVAVGADGVPYLLPEVINTDPFAQGFVLPADSMQIVALWAEFTSGQKVPIHWLPVGRAVQAGVPQGLVATVTQFRLSPVRNPDTAQTQWDDVVSVTVVYIPDPEEFDVTAVDVLDVAITLPGVYGHVLKWELAAWFAKRELALDPKGFPVKLLALFTEQARGETDFAKRHVPLDHRVVKTHRLTRNR